MRRGVAFRGVLTGVRACVLACLRALLALRASGPAVRGPRRQDEPCQGGDAGSLFFVFDI